MKRIVDWIRTNPIVSIIIFLLILIILRDQLGNGGIANYSLGQSAMMRDAAPVAEMDYGRMGSSKMAMPIAGGQPYYPTAPSDSANRMVVTDTSMSLVVRNVEESMTVITDAVKSLGGFMISMHVSSPSEGGSGTISFRVPSENLDSAKESLRRLSIRVVSINVNGTDVTDQYEDLDTRLATVELTKQKIQDIFDRATEVSDLLALQQELINVQSQIDSIKGQQRYLSQTAKYALVTAYLSTDELSLPYAPDDAFRPAVVFRQAVRSLMRHVRQVLGAAIWIAVYSPIWVPVTLIILFLKRKLSR